MVPDRWHGISRARYLHLIIVGPLYGSIWVGYYTWVLQLCMLASQVFVQISARVALSVTAKSTEFSARWTTIASQLAVLTTITAPILATVVIAMPTVDHVFFADKWLPALVLLPLLCARMIPGIACSPVGTLLLVERGARSFAVYAWVWTAFEAVTAYIAVKLLGTIGLAVSYACGAWFGLYVMTRPLNTSAHSLFVRICGIIFRRPVLWMSVATASAFICFTAWTGHAVQPWLAVCGSMAVIIIFGVDSDIRLALRGGRA